MFLLDTNVISELRRPRPHGAVAAWIAAQPATGLFISAVSLGELQAGAEITRRQDPQKATALDAWIDAVARSGSVLPMDGATFRQWARLLDRQSRDMSEDAMIAATALIHDLTVVTRNVRDFLRFGVRLLDPFQARAG